MKAAIKSIKLAVSGRGRVHWADKHMPVMRKIRERFNQQKPFKGVRISACLHVTSETANLMRALKDGGAQLALCASNPLSTQDDVAACLVKDYGIAVFAVHGANRSQYYQHIQGALSIKPHITIDDGADLISILHAKHKNLVDKVWAGMEETTTGVIRLKAMAKAGGLRYPLFSVNDAHTKYLFDNRYGTGQSTIDGIIRATNILMAGRNLVVVGYGWCGRGVAMRARGLGANVIVAEVDPIRALEAIMDGYRVMPMREAARIGDIFVTLTGDINVIDVQHFKLMKSGTILANSGHFNVELNLDGLAKITKTIKRNIRPNVDEHLLRNGRSLFVLAQGRLVNLACAEGHPATVMDMSFATQSLVAEHVVKNHTKLTPQVYAVPKEIEDWIARLKLVTLGIRIDKLTPRQKKYLSSWTEGT